MLLHRFISIFVATALFAVSIPTAAFAQQTVPAGGTGLSSVPAGAFLVGNSQLRLAATTSPTAGWFTATSTRASRFPYASTTAVSANSFCLNSDTCITSWPSSSGSSFSTTSADYWILQYPKGFFFSTTSATYFESTFSRWATTSSDYWQTQRNFFSTTSADAWEATKTRWATTSSAYFLLVNQGAAFSTTSADAWKSTRNFFSTTSADAWEATKWRWATSSSDYWLTVNRGNAFSTTSADYWGSTKGYLTTVDISANTNLAATWPVVLTNDTLSLAWGTTTANTWSQLQTFQNGFVSQASSTVVGSSTSLALKVLSAVDFFGTYATSLSGLCTAITGGSGLCDGSDATGSGGAAAIATSSGETRGGIATWTSTNGTPATLGSTATSTLTPSSPLTGSFIQIGSSGSVGIQAATASQGGYETQNEFNYVHSATTTFSSPLTYTGSTNAVTCPTCITSVAGFPWSRLTTYATSTNASTTPMWFQTAFYASSTVNAPSIIDNLFVTQNATFTKATTSAFALSGLVNAILSTNANGSVIATTSIGTNYLTANTISGVALGGTLASHSHDSTLSGTSYNGSAAVSDWGLNLGNANTWTAKQTFGAASTTDFSTSNSAFFTQLTGFSLVGVDQNKKLVTVASSSLYGTGSAGQVLAWANGVPTWQSTSTCAQITGSSALCDGDDATGSGAGWPFTPGFYNSVANQSTTTPLWLKNTMVIASSTFFTQASTTQFTNSGTTWLTGFNTFSLIGTDQTGKIVQVASSSLYGTGTNGQVLALVNGVPTFVSTSTCIQITGSSDLCDGTDNTGGAPSWGSITGTLANQTDLDAKFATKFGTSSAVTANQLIYATGQNTVASVATSTLTASSPLTGSFIQIGSGGSLGCQTASGSQAGCLSAVDWTRFNSATTTFNYPLSYSGSTNSVSLLWGTTTANTWSALQTITAASTTYFTATNFWAGSASATSLILSASKNGVLVTDMIGTVSASSTLGLNRIPTCVQITGSAGLCDGDDATGGGGGGAWPFTIDSYAGALAQSTTTPLWLKNTALYASTTLFTYASTSQLTVGSNTWLTGFTYGDIGTDGTGKIISIATSSAYAGTAGQVLAFADGIIKGVATTTFNSPLTYSAGAVSCATCVTSVTGGLGYVPWGGSIATTFGTTTIASSTPAWFKTGVFASSTSQFDYSSTTRATFGTIWNTGITSAVVVTDSGGKEGAASAQTCTNQFFRSLSAAYVVTCASVNLASDVTGTLPIANGGTASTTVTNSMVPYISGSVYSGNPALLAFTGSKFGIATSAPAKELSVTGEIFATATTTTGGLNVLAPSVGTSTAFIYSNTAGFGGRIILEDSGGAACTAITTSAGTIRGEVVTCPQQL